MKEEDPNYKRALGYFNGWTEDKRLKGILAAFNLLEISDTHKVELVVAVTDPKTRSRRTPDKSLNHLQKMLLLPKEKINNMVIILAENTLSRNESLSPIRLKKTVKAKQGHRNYE